VRFAIQLQGGQRRFGRPNPRAGRVAVGYKSATDAASVELGERKRGRKHLHNASSLRANNLFKRAGLRSRSTITSFARAEQLELSRSNSAKAYEEARRPAEMRHAAQIVAKPPSASRTATTSPMTNEGRS